MGQALEILSGHATAPGATVTTVTMASGDSNVIRFSNAQVLLLNMWAKIHITNIKTAVAQVTSPRLHDNVKGILARVTPGIGFPLLDYVTPQALFSQDTLTIGLSGCATSGDIENISLLIYYQDLGGVMARFIDEPTLIRRMRNKVGVEVDITGGTDGNYHSAAAINSTYDNFKANTDYALLGMASDQEVCTIGLKGADTGNLRVGVPGEQYLRNDAINYFWMLSKLLNRPLIPVINSGNKAQTTVDVIADETASVNPDITLNMAELGP